MDQSTGTVMKLHLLALIILLGGTLAAQDDVSNEDQSAYEMKLGKADALRDEIGQARASGDVEREITRSMELVFYLMNDLGDRVESYERALALEDLLDQHRDTEVYQRIAPRLYFELGYFLQDQNDFASGRDYMIRAIELGEEYGMDRKTMDWRLHLSAVYMNLDNRDASLELLDRVAAQAALLNDPVAVERAHEFRMCFHLHYDELDEARTYGLLSLGEYNPSNQLAFRNGILSEIYYKLGQNDSAAVFAERALEISVENGWIREEQEAHKHLRIIYKNLGDFERSVYHHERYDELQSELRSFETARAIGLANAQKAETERKLQEELASQQLASQRFIILLIAIGLAVLICVVIYIANRLQVIRNQKAEIEREKLRAERSERAKEQFLANMSHEIRTPMNAISGMISSLLRREHSDEQRVFLRAMKQS
ncbi:MAG: histidine kinase dimerization/phospho-acceptor domain-containing protein, partial [Saprospiraceae bacterium]|nr:histidine kinase dimerization/phospho-acceptor domain-containing protein [Saprospiraceae bacterium]